VLGDRASHRLQNPRPLSLIHAFDNPHLTSSWGVYLLIV
jgi:hypothetical protein